MLDLQRHLIAIALLSIGAVPLACAPRCGQDPAGLDPPARDGGALSCIDGDRAMESVRTLVALGPRSPGSTALEDSRGLILSRLREFGLSPERRDFVALTPHPDMKSVPMANITVDIAGPGTRRVLVAGHYDGKLLPGVDFRAANDGGSSTALLLEMARCLALHPPPCPVRLAFLDGEEALVEWSESDGLYGSKRLAMEMKASGEAGDFAAAVVVDMIGDARLRLFRETLSSPWVAATLERRGREIGHGVLFSGPRGAVEDDHIPFQRVGIPAAVLIDLAYGPGWDDNGYWHTDSDTPDKLSPRSLEAVGRIVIASLADLAAGSE